eukprot:2705856-Prymnesium_polylepis.1
MLNPLRSPFRTSVLPGASLMLDGVGSFAFHCAKVTPNDGSITTRGQSSTSMPARTALEAAGSCTPAAASISHPLA